MHITHILLFQTTKIQTFESNSQRITTLSNVQTSCFRLQRYKLLKAIHNRLCFAISLVDGCFRLQRYKLLKAIHNPADVRDDGQVVVSDYKDTNFWKQFTTCFSFICISSALFQTTKIQTFESNSQREGRYVSLSCCCFRLQRYKLLKAIHNKILLKKYKRLVVSDYKDTNFWKQFTTWAS